MTSSAQYQQFNLSEYYSLSRRTGLHARQAFQRTNGNTPGTGGAGQVISATATIGDGFQRALSSSHSQFAAGVGIGTASRRQSIVKKEKLVVTSLFAIRRPS
jgi:hypothetical protein